MRVLCNSCSNSFYDYGVQDVFPLGAKTTDAVQRAAGRRWLLQVVLSHPHTKFGGTSEMMRGIAAVPLKSYV